MVDRQAVRSASGRLAPAALALAAVLLTGGPGTAQTVPSAGFRPGGPILHHNPVFGLGPQTIWRGGIGIELEGEAARHTGPEAGAEEEEFALHAEFLYGVTENLSLTAALPVTRRKSETEPALAPGVGQVTRDATGVGDAVLRAKYRFFHRFAGATQYHAAVIGGVKLPLADEESDPPLGSGSTDALVGATISRDGLRYYLWTSALARINGESDGVRRGHQLRYDAAVGIRPWIPEYTGIDPLLLLEFNGVTAGENEVDGVARGETGGTTLALSPGFWLTYRNWALKGGVKLPVYQVLGETVPELDYTAVLAVETHL